MRQVTLSLAIFFTLSLIISCQSGPSQADQDYQKLLMQEDSIAQADQMLQTEHDRLMNEHQQLRQQLEAMANPDTTLLETLAGQDAMMANHEAILQKHQQLRQSHDELKQKMQTGNMSNDEKEAQVDEMRNNQETMLDEIQQMRNENDDFRKTHENIRDKMQNGKM